MYSLVKKDCSSTAVAAVASDPQPSDTQESSGQEPIYMEPPPVPEKNYDLLEVLPPETGRDGAGAALPPPPPGAVMVRVDDENGQDSGSGYYAVTDDGPTPSLVVSPHDGLPGTNYTSSYETVFCGFLYCCSRYGQVKLNT